MKRLKELKFDKVSIKELFQIKGGVSRYGICNTSTCNSTSSIVPICKTCSCRTMSEGL